MVDNAIVYRDVYRGAYREDIAVKATSKSLEIPGSWGRTVA